MLATSRQYITETTLAVDKGLVASRAALVTSDGNEQGSTEQRLCQSTHLEANYRAHNITKKSLQSHLISRRLSAMYQDGWVG